MAEAAETSAPLQNGIDAIPVAAIKPDPDAIPDVFPPETDFDASADVDLRYFTQDDLTCIKKCMDNMKLVIKDYETQIDWHLQQYINLRNMATREGRVQQRADLNYLTKKGILSLSNLNTMMNRQDGNRNFGKRRTADKNGSANKRRKRPTSSEESEDSEYDSEFMDEEYLEHDGEFRESEDEDDPEPTVTKKSGKASKTPNKRGKTVNKVEIKDEIEEEYNELIVPKEELGSEDETLAVPTSAKKGKKKATATPARKAKKPTETIDLTSIKKCSVVLKRVDDDENDSE